MKVFDGPLTEEEINAHLTDGRLEAVVKVSLADTIDAEGLDQFNTVIDDFFPSVVLSDIYYEIVGFTPPHKGDSTLAKGELHIKVRADIN